MEESKIPGELMNLEPESQILMTIITKRQLKNGLNNKRKQKNLVTTLALKHD